MNGVEKMAVKGMAQLWVSIPYPNRKIVPVRVRIQ